MSGGVKYVRYVLLLNEKAQRANNAAAGIGNDHNNVNHN